MDLFELARNLLAAVGLIAVLAVLLAAAWLGTGEPMDEHWPVGLDDEPLLDVQNHIGDSRPIDGMAYIERSRMDGDPTWKLPR